MLVNFNPLLSTQEKEKEKGEKERGKKRKKEEGKGNSFVIEHPEPNQVYIDVRDASGPSAISSIDQYAYMAAY